MNEPVVSTHYHDNGPDTYTIEFFDDARTYPVARELLVEWTETLNELERLRHFIWNGGDPWVTFFGMDENVCHACGRDEWDKPNHYSDCPWLAEKQRRERGS